MLVGCKCEVTDGDSLLPMCEFWVQLWDIVNICVCRDSVVLVGCKCEVTDGDSLLPVCKLWVQLWDIVDICIC